MNYLSLFLFALIFWQCDTQKTGTDQTAKHQKDGYQTYCNPVDIDYSYMSHYAYRGVSYRSGADPAVINYNGTYFMFVTRSHGYWMSNDMNHWEFIEPVSWYFNGSNAPAAAVRGEEVLVLGDPSGRGAIIKTSDPVEGRWQTTYSVLPLSIQDPCLFVDDDRSVFLYEGSSNRWPIYGVQLDPSNHYIPMGEQDSLINLQPEKHGWERFGQDHVSDLKPFIEGPWMIKHGDTYYLEYGAPGTQWNVYADGIYTSKDPLGPFTYAGYNPVSYKPGGFLAGAGHGSTVRDNQGNYWHFATMAISVNYKFERRIGMFPAGFESDGQMYVNTAYGDYPHYLPETPVDNHKNRFTGWMLLSYHKPVKTNSTASDTIKRKVVDESDTGHMLEQEVDRYDISLINDENIRTFWVAASNSDSIWVEMDLESLMTIYALQINFQDFNASIFGRPDTLRQQFIIETSEDGQNWETSVDFSKNQQDHPHAYIELEKPVKARYVRYRNLYFPNQYLAISDWRIFGKGPGEAPEIPENFEVKRMDDRRNAELSWTPVDDALGYVVYWGNREDRLNLSMQFYDRTDYTLRALNTDEPYFFQIESFNENGISKRSEIISRP